MNLYKAFYQGRSMEVESDTTYHAQQKAAVLMNVSKSKTYLVNVMVLSVHGTPVLHSTASLS